MEATTSRRIDTVDVAKMLRKALKAEFPGVKFSVRSSRYAGGSSVDVSYTDGPRQRRVQEVCDRYEGASFDGMIDLKSYHDTIITTDEGAEVVHFGADFVHAQRRISHEFEAECVALLEEFTGEDYDPNKRYPVAVCWHSMYDGTPEAGELAHDHHGGEWGSTIIHQMSMCQDR